MDEILEFEDENFYADPSLERNYVRLSQLNNKSSVLRPESEDITGQYLALQQLDAHQRMILRAKGSVDTSAPKSMQSYLSVAGHQKKKRWHKQQNQSMSSKMNETCDVYSNQISSRAKSVLSIEEDNRSLNISSVSKGVQTGAPFTIYNSLTANKISWYLDAVRQGELQPHTFIYTDQPRIISQQRHQEGPIRKKFVRTDIMDWHKNCFVQPSKPFSPRILNDNTAKSKVREMRVYNPPYRKNKSNSVQSSDTFESYNDDENQNDEEADTSQKTSDSTSVEDETVTNKNHHSRHHKPYPKTSLHTDLHFQSRERQVQPASHSEIISRNEEEKYLSFLSKVTEDILRSGVYSDGAIQQTFDFHMQFYQEDPNKDKLKSLLNQVLQGLQIRGDDATGSPYRKDHELHSIRANTPPVKEASDNSFSNDYLGNESNLSTAVESNSNLQSLNLNFDNVLRLVQNTPDEPTQEESEIS